MTFEEFVSSLRSKYPEYNDLDDDTLGTYVLE